MSGGMIIATSSARMFQRRRRRREHEEEEPSANFPVPRNSNAHGRPRLHTATSRTSAGHAKAFFDVFH